MSSVTSVEVYGFVGWVASAAALVLYVLWAYVPDRILWWHGVTYYPSKYWAVAFPTWLCVSVVAVYWMYEGLNMMSARPPREASQPPDGMVQDVKDFQFFSSAGSSGILPLTILPEEVVDMVLKEGKTPHEAERLYKEQLKLQREQFSTGMRAVPTR